MTQDLHNPQQGTSLRVVHVVMQDETVRWSVATLLMTAGFAVQAHASSRAFMDVFHKRSWRGAGCVLAEARHPQEGLAAIHQMRDAGCSLPIVLLTAPGDVNQAVQAMKAGVFDFVEKPYDGPTLIRTVHAALQVSAEAEADAEVPEDHWLGNRAVMTEAAARVAALSPRERAVLDLAMEGKPSKVIAHELGISPRTVEVHRLRMIARLGVRSIAEAVRLSVWAELAASEKGGRPPKG